MCMIRGGVSVEGERGWFLTTSVALPRQKAAEERNFSPKARARAGEARSPRKGATKKRRGDGGGTQRSGKERWW